MNGSSTAFHLTAGNGFDGRVLVVERDPSYEGAPSARATGGIRQQFSTPENIRMGLYGARFVKRLLDNGVLGDIRRFDIREGFVYEWPVTSDFMFRREAGGGVLADTGAHVLDMALWLLGLAAACARIRRTPRVCAIQGACRRSSS